MFILLTFSGKKFQQQKNRHTVEKKSYCIEKFGRNLHSFSFLLQLSNCCTDQLLAVIGTNCKSLEVLDAEEDSEMMTTDHGLSFLTNCVKLTTIILNDAGDEYDYEDRYFGITGMHISYLEFIKGGFISEFFHFCSN